MNFGPLCLVSWWKILVDYTEVAIINLEVSPISVDEFWLFTTQSKLHCCNVHSGMELHTGLERQNALLYITVTNGGCRGIVIHHGNHNSLSHVNRSSLAHPSPHPDLHSTKQLQGRIFMRLVVCWQQENHKLVTGLTAFYSFCFFSSFHFMGYIWHAWETIFAQVNDSKIIMNEETR